MKSYRLVFWLLALCGFAVDQGSKYTIFSYLYNEGDGGEIEMIPGAFKIAVAKYHHETIADDGTLSTLRKISAPRMPYVNHGALFGIGQDHNLLFAIISVAAALGIVYCIHRSNVGQDKLLCVALGLILAGTLGNLVDRVLFHGVRDFLWWYGVVNWPVFNVADCCLVCGAGTLLIQAFFLPEPISQAVPQDAAAAVTE